MNDAIERTEASERMLVHALERLGWSLLAAEVDVDAQVARVELRRGDLLVTLDARNGAATITRERVRTTTERTGRRGDAYRAERMHVEFLGRSRHEGVRSAMRSLANYVEDNASTPKALPGAARAAFRAMLGGCDVGRRGVR